LRRRPTEAALRRGRVGGATFRAAFPGTLDFAKWEKDVGAEVVQIDGVPLTRYWLVPPAKRPKVYMPHPTMSAEAIRLGTQQTWDQFYSLPLIWQRSRFLRTLRSRLAFLLISKLYRQMYANTGIATDSARSNRSARWARWLARPCRRLFVTDPSPSLPNTPGNRVHAFDSRRADAVPVQIIRAGQPTRR
jgi:hypothetical protein